MTCQAILKWLNTDPSNIAFIHCQSNKGRSAVIISSVLNLLQIFKDPLEAVAYFSSVRLLKIKNTHRKIEGGSK